MGLVAFPPSAAFVLKAGRLARMVFGAFGSKVAEGQEALNCRRLLSPPLPYAQEQPLASAYGGLEPDPPDQYL